MNPYPPPIDPPTSVGLESFYAVSTGDPMQIFGILALIVLIGLAWQVPEHIPPEKESTGWVLPAILGIVVSVIVIAAFFGAFIYRLIGKVFGVW